MGSESEKCFHGEGDSLGLRNQLVQLTTQYGYSIC